MNTSVPAPPDIDGLLVYIAGPMTGLPGYNFGAFASARTHLRSMGAFVACPAEMDLAEGFDPDRSAESQGFDLRAAFRRDLEAIADADAVVFLPGFTRSAGALAEYELARALGLALFTLSGPVLTQRSPEWMDQWIESSRADPRPTPVFITAVERAWQAAA